MKSAPYFVRKSVTLGLLWAWRGGGVGWLFMLYMLYMLYMLTTVLFGGVTWSKFAHIFFKLTCVEFPFGYGHGRNQIPASSVQQALEGKSAGDIIEVPIDGNRTSKQGS